ncbi:MAG TPA: uL22 family ribosomal protein [Candidatus Nanoarchaeia archaeon]|nr:uL22 family ribosomal protein [Candidatus Nanoarchaeia archaeon]
MTEKQYAPTKTEKKTQADGMNKKQKINAPIVDKSITEKKTDEKNSKVVEEVKKPETKQKVEKVKKSIVVVNGVSVPVSKKYSMAICRFIKNKRIDRAISELEEVLIFKRIVPMKGEIPHRKGKGMMSGRYPIAASKHFIKLLKSLKGNTINHELENPVIKEAIANQARRPVGKFGAWKRKRTHIKIVAVEKKILNQESKQKAKEKKE